MWQVRWVRSSRYGLLHLAHYRSDNMVVQLVLVDDEQLALPNKVPKALAFCMGPCSCNLNQRFLTILKVRKFTRIIRMDLGFAIAHSQLENQKLNVSQILGNIIYIYTCLLLTICLKSIYYSIYPPTYRYIHI